MTGQQPDAHGKNRLVASQIIETALAMIDAEGAHAFSIRNLSRAFGVTPMALYRHVDGRSGLLGQVVDLILCDIGKNDGLGDSSISFADLSHAYGAAAMRHPQALLAFLGDADARSAEADRLSAQMVSALTLLGYSPEVAGILRNIVVDHTHGYVVACACQGKFAIDRALLASHFHTASSVLLEKLLL